MTEYYRIGGFNKACSECKLSTGFAVGGQAEVPLEEVRLIVVSAYPGRNEVKENISLASKETDISCSAGAFLRKCIAGVFADASVPPHLKDFYKHIYATNAIKCEKRTNNVTDTHIKSCFNTWLREEINYFPSEVPILLAAGEAFKSLFPGQGGIYKNRRRQDLVYNGHPCLATLNPIEWERGAMRIVTEQTVGVRSGVITPVTTKLWTPYPVGSVLWHIRKDLIDVRNMVLEYERTREGG